jgi:hypothetical protein
MTRKAPCDVVELSRRSMTLLADLADFIADHRPHGTLTAEADADRDLLMMARQN